MSSFSFRRNVLYGHHRLLKKWKLEWPPENLLYMSAKVYNSPVAWFSIVSSWWRHSDINSISTHAIILRFGLTFTVIRQFTKEYHFQRLAPNYSTPSEKYEIIARLDRRKKGFITFVAVSQPEIVSEISWSYPEFTKRHCSDRSPDYICLWIIYCRNKK